MTEHPGSGGRVAIVTGATSGIGRAVAARLAAEGLTVVGVGLGCASVRPEAHVDLHEVDVRLPDAIDKFVASVVAEHGRIDVLCNAAGVKLRGDILKVGPEDLTETFAVNVAGTIHTIKAVLPTMIAQRAGTIVNVGSPSAVADPATIAYSASKAAVAAITTSLALDLTRHHIRVNLVVPGTTRTGMNADRSEETWRALGSLNVSGRVNEPDDVAGVVSFLASESAATISGAQIDIGTIQGLIPTLPSPASGGADG